MKIARDDFQYDEDLSISPDELDTCWLDQAPSFWKYARMLADAGREVDRAKENLDVVKSDIDQKVRLKPEKYGLEKVTEKAIESIMHDAEEYQEANTKLIDAKYNESMAKNAVRAFEHRRDALENLVRLHASSYFAGPSVPRDLSKEWETKQVRKQSNASVSSKLKKKIKRTK